MSNQKHINHILWRAGFGPSLKQLQQFQSPQQATEQLFADAKQYAPISVVQLDQAMDPGQRKNMSKEELKKMHHEDKAEMFDVTTSWLMLMTDDQHALREKMSLFWHGHLACRCDRGYSAQQYANTIRRNAMGNYRTLLLETSQTGAMMSFLNTLKNRKGSPNENFARELMELFTLGRGNYTEQDVKEAARAFTGWSIEPPGRFIVREQVHDNGMKTIFGKRGNFTGEDVIDMLLEKKQTAKYVTTKMYRYFVNDEVNQEKVEALSLSFYNSGYDINKLMKETFTADWFYDEKNIGTKIKSPIDLLAGLTRMYGLTYENPKTLMLVQRVMGQALLSPPNVAGWPGGKNWIDSSSLMFRLDLGSLLVGQSQTDVLAKGDPDREEQTMKMAPAEQSRLRNVRATVDWTDVYNQFQKDDRQMIYGQLLAIQIQPEVSALLKEEVLTFSEVTSKEQYIQNVCLKLVSIPEYQLC